MAKSRLAVGAEVYGSEIRLVVLEVPAADNAECRVVAARRLSNREEFARTLRGLPSRPAELVTTVSLRGAAIRTLNLPPTTDENLERAILLEAESALPLTGEDLALSHHVLGMTEQSRVEILVAAAHQATIQAVLDQVNCLGYLSAKCTVTPAALWNLMQARALMPREGAIAVLRAEEDETEIYLIGKAGLIQTNYYAFGLSEGEGWTERISSQVRQLCQILAYERGLTVERLWLCGPGADRPMSDFDLARGTELHVQQLGVDGFEGEGGVMAAAYGCALQAAGRGQVALNLTPARVAAERESEQRRQTRYSWGTLVGATAVAAGLVIGAMMTQRQRQLSSLQGDLQSLKGVERIDAPSPTTLKKTQEAVAALTVARVPPGRLLASLSSQLPTSVWLSELTYSANTGCVIRGASTDQSGPQRAQIALLRQRLFDEVSLDYRTEELLNNVPVWGFQMTCKLRPAEKKKPQRGRTATARR